VAAAAEVFACRRVAAPVGRLRPGAARGGGASRLVCDAGLPKVDLPRSDRLQVLVVNRDGAEHLQLFTERIRRGRKRGVPTGKTRPRWGERLTCLWVPWSAAHRAVNLNKCEESDGAIDSTSA